MKFRTYFLTLLILVLMSLVTFSSVFKYQDSPQIAAISKIGVKAQFGCIEHKTPAALDDDGKLSLLVWNIYKQSRSDWSKALDTYSQGRQLLLLQEAALEKPLRHWVEQGQWNGNQADAFRRFDISAGVLSLAKELPLRACAYTELEPWIRLPKSALYSTYSLSNGQTLAVVNIHAINFTYGTVEYRQQISTLASLLTNHTGR